MSAETLHHSSIPTPSQETARRLFVKEHARPEDRLKRMGANTAVLAGATLVDLGESVVAEKLIDTLFEGKIHHLKHEINLNGSDKVELKKQLKETQARQMGVLFVEDSMSDFAYAAGMNALLRSMTGLEHTEYVSESAAFASEWTNVISLVFGNRPADLKVWQKSENFINPVNVEAGLRVIEDIPVVGDAVAWAHEKLEHALHKSAALKMVNKVAATFVTGYHIRKNMMS
jgi:hypothetical protein